MTDLQKIRFITANFPILQGLKLMPVGIILSYASVFNDAQVGKETRDLSIPCLLTPLFIAAYVLIHLYYQRTFGRVESTTKSRGKDFLVSMVVLAVGYAAFAVDSMRWIPVSFFALFLALVLLWTQAWMVRQAGSKNLALFPPGLVCIALIFLSALLPLMRDKAAGLFGFHYAMTLVGVVIGILYMFYGVLEHLFLVRSLGSAGAADQKQSVLST